LRTSTCNAACRSPWLGRSPPNSPNETRWPRTPTPSSGSTWTTRSTAAASALSFLLGGVLSLLAILIPPAGIRIQVCVAVVLTSLAGTGYLAARFGSAPTARAALRNLTIGSVTMAVTYALSALTQALL